MFGISGYWAFLLGAALIVLLPGPNSMFVLTTAARDGVRRGYQAALGVFVADTTLMVASVAGAAGVLAAHANAFRAVKYAGALYLGYIGLRLVLGGIQRLRGAPDDGEVPDEVAAVVGSDAELAHARRARTPFFGALLLGLLNPKAILFFIAFFVQFVNPADPAATRHFAVLGATVQVFSLSYLSALILAGSRLAASFARRRCLAAWATAAVGFVFIAFGVMLATATIS